MKEKIMYLILGILIGAVITAGCFLVFAKGPREKMDPGFGGRPDFENMTEEEREEMRKNFKGQRPDGAPKDMKDFPNGDKSVEPPTEPEA